MTYQTLSQPCTAVYEIKKSKFLAFAYPISDKEEIMFHVKQLRQLYPDARHHCLAYIQAIQTIPLMQVLMMMVNQMAQRVAQC